MVGMVRITFPEPSPPEALLLYIQQRNSNLGGAVPRFYQAAAETHGAFFDNHPIRNDIYFE